MKRLLLGVCVFGVLQQAMAQDRPVEVSVYNNYKDLPAVRSEKTVTQQAKLTAQLPGWLLSFDKISGCPLNLAGAPLTLQGSSIEQKAAYFTQQYLNAFGLETATWKTIRNNATAKTQYLTQQQTVNGRAVAFSNLAFHFTPKGDLKWVQAKVFPAQDNLPQPVISANTSLKSAQEGLTNIAITHLAADEQWVWFPIPSAAGYELHPAYSFSIEGKNKATNMPVKLYGYVDAATGTLLYRSDKVTESINLTVKGSVYKSDVTQPATQEPLAGLDVVINGTQYYLDANGNIANNAITLPTSVQLSLQNSWCQVLTDGDIYSMPVFSGTVNANGTMLFPATMPSSDRHVNAFYHVTSIHDFMKQKLPSFTYLDNQLPTNVDVSGGTCNAYFDYSSINFFAAGGGCTSFAEISSVVAHEYGHAISGFFYYEQTGQAINNGALNEGNSDVWAMALNEDPIVGKGSSANGLIRRYDIAPKVYPFDIMGESHADAEIIAGAWWDVAVNLNSVPAMSQLFADTYYDTPDGMNGTEGEVFMNVLFSALMQDDNDNDISNGTPNFGAITAAFARHGITLMGTIGITHNEIPNKQANETSLIKASVTIEYPTNFGNVTLYYRNRNTGTAYTPLIMTGTSNVTATIPAMPEGAIVDYYFAVKDPLSFNAATLPLEYNPQLPASKSNIPFQYAVGVKTIDSNLFETAVTGWKIGSVPGDNAASTGRWIWAQPVASSSQTMNYTLNCQTGQDFTTGAGKCLVTGNAASSNSPISTADVDNGKTTVLSPVMDLTGLTDPSIEYRRWFSNNRGDNPGNDPWRVQITNDGTTWRDVENSFVSDSRWRRNVFKVKDFVTPNATVQVRFIASDSLENLNMSGQSVVEAAIDNFFLYDNKNAPNTGLNEQQLAQVLMYPNPANETLTISLPQQLKNVQVSISDITGKQLWHAQATSGDKITISTAKFPAGQYLVTLHDGQSIRTSKVTISH